MSGWSYRLAALPHAPTRVARVQALVLTLMRLVGVFRHRVGPSAEAVILYIDRTGRRLVALMRRLEDGTWRAPRARARRARGEAEAPAEAPARRPRLRFSRRRGWLGHHIHPEGGPNVTEFIQMLEDPEMRALLAPAAPQVARLLRPLAHMLGRDIAIAPPLPRRARPAAARPRRPAVAERKAALWYPNVEGKPIDLYAASKKMR